MKLFLRNTYLFPRIALFLVSFLIISGWYGSWIISTKLLYPFYFFIYGNMGKMLLFSLLALFLLTRKKWQDVRFPAYDTKNLVFVIMGIILAPLFFSLAQRLLQEQSFFSNIALSLVTHVYLLTIPFLFGLGFLGLGFFKTIIAAFRKELLVCLGLSVIFYFAVFYIWGFWPYLSDGVLRVVHFLFSLTHQNVIVIPPRTLFVETFAVTIDQACSGLESFLLFSGLFALIGLTEWKDVHHTKFLSVYILGIAALFFVNILRVYLIIWSGIIFSPQIAATLFHTYLGMILFLLYFVLLLRTTYKWFHV
jgi:exosortase/archaeosortase family protein